MIEFVSATSTDLDGFRQTPLGRSFEWLAARKCRFSVRIKLRNFASLPLAYNRAIESSEADILVFVLDDVWLMDGDLDRKLEDALGNFDVVGVVGGRTATENTVKWYEAGETSGSIRSEAFDRVYRFGPAPAQCAMLDGQVLAARTSTLRASGVRFDPRFFFFMYDLDFCRSARHAGLRLGTWPITVRHDAPEIGNVMRESATDQYLHKWAGAPA